MNDMQFLVSEFTSVAIIGNGPSGIICSYLLDGNWPYLQNIQDIPDSLLKHRLSNVNIDQSLLQMDLEYLSEGLEGRSSNPVSVLFDILQHPNADMGDLPSDFPKFLRWKFDESLRIPHLVIGDGMPGGFWQNADGSLRTLSNGNWMELPEFSFCKWYSANRIKNEQAKKKIDSLFPTISNSKVQELNNNFEADTNNNSTDLEHSKNVADNSISIKMRGEIIQDLPPCSIKPGDISISPSTRIERGRASFVDIRDYYTAFVNEKDILKNFRNHRFVDMVEKRHILSIFYEKMRNIQTLLEQVFEDDHISKKNSNAKNCKYFSEFVHELFSFIHYDQEPKTSLSDVSLNCSFCRCKISKGNHTTDEEVESDAFYKKIFQFIMQDDRPNFKKKLRNKFDYDIISRSTVDNKKLLNFASQITSLSVLFHTASPTYQTFIDKVMNNSDIRRNLFGNLQDEHINSESLRENIINRFLSQYIHNQKHEKYQTQGFNLRCSKKDNKLNLFTDYLWHIRGHFVPHSDTCDTVVINNTCHNFEIFASDVILATGMSRSGNSLNVFGENLPFVKHSLQDLSYFLNLHHDIGTQVAETSSVSSGDFLFEDRQYHSNFDLSSSNSHNISSRYQKSLLQRTISTKSKTFQTSLPGFSSFCDDGFLSKIFPFHLNANGDQNVKNSSSTKNIFSNISPSQRIIENSTPYNNQNIHRKICIIGAGLSASDCILLARAFDATVIHIFRRSAFDKAIIMSQLPSAIYPEYHSVLSLMKVSSRRKNKDEKNKDEDDGYSCFEKYSIVGFQYAGEDRSKSVVLIKRINDKQSINIERLPDRLPVKMNDVAVSSDVISIPCDLAVVQIGFVCSLSFLTNSGRNLAGKSDEPITAKRNPVLIHPFTHETIEESHLYAMGPLIGDTFIRFLQGGAIAIVNDLLRKRQRMSDQLI